MVSERFEVRWERELDTLTAAVEYPATPAIGPRVMAAVVAQPTAPRPALRWTPRFAVAAALTLLVVLATLAVPSTRTAVGEFFGLVEGERIEVLPTLPPEVAPTVLPTPPPLESLGTPFTLEELTAAAGFEPVRPNDAEPNALYLVDFDGVPIAVLQYDDYDLWQTRETGFGYFSKGVPPTSFIDTPQVGSNFGYWISGGSYVVRFINADGDEVIGSERTIDRNTLIWRGDRSNVFYRLETSLPLEAALAIAEALP